MRSLLAATFALMLSATAQGQDTLDPAAGRDAFLAANYEKAKRILAPLAEQGNAEAQYWIGVMYAHGRGYPENCRAAARWYERAAAQGHREATFNLGFMLYHGWGSDPAKCTLPADPERAAPWLMKAAALGIPRAQYLLGRMFRTGDGLKRSMDDAFDWLGEAAAAGLPEAQFDLAVMYAEASNRRDACFWFLVLAAKGYPGARQNAAALAANMTAAEVTEAERRARAWTPAER